MRINWILISYSIALALCLKSYGNDLSFKERMGTLQTNNSIPELSALANDCETLWPSNETLYFQYEYAIERTLAKSAKNSPVALRELENQTEKIVDKHSDAPDSGNIRFRIKSQVVESFVNVSRSAPDFYGAQILAKFLGEVRATIITNYQSKPVKKMSMMPPGKYVSPGVYVFDTNAMPAYLKALEETSRIDDKNALQLRFLPEVNQEITSDFFSYSKVLLARNPQLKDQVSNLAVLARLTSGEQRKLSDL